MKKTVRFFFLVSAVLLSVVLFCSTASAKGKINLELKKTADGVSLEWNGKKKETYTVYRKTGKGKYVKIKTLKGKEYLDKKVTSGANYSYYIKNTDKQSEEKVITFISVPKLKTSKVDSSGITLRWKGVDGAEKYVVYRMEKGKKTKRLGYTKKKSFLDSEVKKGIVYTYIVRGVKGKYTSAAAIKKVGRLNKPALVSLENTEDGLLLKWKKTKGALNYVVFRRVKGSDKWKRLGQVDGKVLSFEDKSAESGKKYSYFVRAVAGDSRSLYDEKHLSAIRLEAPGKFSLEKMGKKINLKWNKVTSAKKYQVYRKTDDGKWKKIKEIKGLSYADTPKSLGVNIQYKVRAVNEKNKSTFTEIKSNRDVDPKKPMVALTYDDGPHPVNTHRILDALEKYGARATFFVVGQRITAYNDCLVRQNKLGCETANHSFSHASLSKSSDKKVLEEIEKTDALIEKYTGEPPALIRAPGGSAGKASKLADKPFIYWSVDTLDWKKQSSPYVVKHIKKTVRDGSIILMHDLYGFTAGASESIIPWLIEEGYQLVTVSELFEARGVKLENGKTYYNGYA